LSSRLKGAPWKQFFSSIGGDINVVAGNSVVHVMDKMLLPLSCSRTVISIATESKGHTKLMELLKAADLVTILSATTL